MKVTEQRAVVIELSGEEAEKLEALLGAIGKSDLEGFGISPDYNDFYYTLYRSLDRS